MVLTPPMRRSSGIFNATTADAQGGAAEASSVWAALPGGVIDGGELILFAIKPSMWRPALDSAVWIVAGAVIAVAILLANRSLPGLSVRGTAQLSIAVGFARLAIAIMQWIPTWYVLTNRRLIEIHGARRPVIRDCPLIHVRNTYLQSSACERLLGLGTLTYVRSDDDTDPRQWQSIAQAEEIHARIRRAIEHAIDHQPFES
ncbi:MAG: PH domain-containing protein [Planctomycetes bacterium]|nr:PH domain-containing protein [Planctomycetota bacterium]